MTAPRTRGRTAAGISGVLLAAASVGIAAADGYYRPPSHQTSSTTVSTKPAASDGEGEIEPTVTCGVERWDVKTGTDPAATSVDQSVTKHTTIAKLNAISAPISPHARVVPVETTVYDLTGTLTAYKLEADSDYHLALADRSGHQMIAEIPSPKCVKGGPFKAAIAAVRKIFDARLSATGRFKTSDVPITISGVGFFDKKHGQRGLASNGIELHPLLALEFKS